jgi:hypothetical protein
MRKKTVPNYPFKTDDANALNFETRRSASPQRNTPWNDDHRAVADAAEQRRATARSLRGPVGIDDMQRKVQFHVDAHLTLSPQERESFPLHQRLEYHGYGTRVEPLKDGNAMLLVASSEARLQKANALRESDPRKEAALLVVDPERGQCFKYSDYAALRTNGNVDRETCQPSPTHRAREMER